MSTIFSSEEIAEFEGILLTTKQEEVGEWCKPKLVDSNVLNNIVFAWDDSRKISFIVFLMDLYIQDYKNLSSRERDQAHEFAKLIIKQKPKFTDKDSRLLLSAFQRQKMAHEDNTRGTIHTVYHFTWPIGEIATLLSKQFKTAPEGAVAELEIVLKELDILIDRTPAQNKVVDKLNDLLTVWGAKKAEKKKPFRLLGEDPICVFVDKYMEDLPTNESEVWDQILFEAERVTGSKPTAKFMNSLKPLYQSLGESNFVKLPIDWFTFVVNLENTELNKWSPIYLEQSFINLFKAIVWVCSFSQNQVLMNVLAKLGEHCYQTIPEIGPVSTGLGNACFNTLGLGGENAVKPLVEVKSKLKQKSALKLIDKALLDIATQKGVTVQELTKNIK